MWRRDRLYWLLVGIVTAVAIYGVVVEAPLNQDGSNYLFWIFERRSAFVPFGRSAVWIEQLPAVLAAHTGDFALTRTAFVVAYAATPAALFAVAAALVWRLPRIYLAALVLGMLVATFAAQTFYVAESVIALQLWWCAWAAFAPADCSRRRRVIGCVLLVLAIFTHLAAVPLVAALVVVVAIRDRRRVILVAVVAASAVVVLLVVSGGVPDYERDSMPHGVGALTDPLGRVLLAGFALLVVALVLVWLAPDRTAVSIVLATAGVGLVVIAAVRQNYSAGWAYHAVWLPALAVALVACLMLLQPIRALSRESYIALGAVILVGVWAVALVFALHDWDSTVEDVRRELAAVHDCGRPSAHLRSDNPWSLTTLSLALEGTHPSRVLVDPGTCSQWNAGWLLVYDERQDLVKVRVADEWLRTVSHN